MLAVIDLASIAAALVAYGPLAGLVGVVILTIYGVIRETQQRRSFDQITDDDAEPAFHVPATFDLSKKELESMRGKVHKVCVMRNIRASGGGEAGEDFDPVFSAFLVDVNGVTHDLCEPNKDWGHVSERAKRLAVGLGVPFEDTSYGTH